MRVLLISNMWPSLKHPHYGVFVENTYRELLRDGLDVSKIAICKHDTLFGKLKEYAFFFIKVVLGIASRRYEVVYAHYASHTACPILIGRVLNPRIRVVVNVHGNDIVPETGKDAFFVRHSKKLIAIAKFVISPSEYFARILEADFFVPRDKIVVYPSGGVDTRLFAPRDRKLSREKFSFEKSNYVIGLFGRIEKDKGWDVFLQAAAQLIEREDKDYKLFVIGEGSCEKEFWDLASRLNLRPYIEKRDMVSQHVLADAYSAVDVFVFPTRRASDSLGLVGLEAMSCQALLVVGDKYGPSSYAVDGWNCVCFDPFRWESLYEALSFVTSIGDERIVDAIKGRARETALEYDSAKSSGKLTRVFEDIAGER